jgi:hypothetical protein
MVFVPADFVNGADVGVVQLGGCPGFPSKAFEGQLVVSNIFG